MIRTRLMAVTLALGAVASSVTPRAQGNPQRELRAAIETEDGKGCPAAVEQYRKVSGASDRSIAAAALVRLGECYRKLGDAKSRTVYERLVEDYSDQTEAFSLARAQLGLFGRGRATTALAKRLICSDCVALSDDVSKDGRWIVQTDPEGRRELLVREISTRRIVRRWAVGAGVPLSPRFSPDGQHIAFVRATGDSLLPADPSVVAASLPTLLSSPVDAVALAGVLPPTLRTQVLVVGNRDGAEPTVLVDSTDDQSFINRQILGWSPDSQWVFLRWVPPGSSRLATLARVSRRNKAFEPLGSLQQGVGLSSSPDGRHVAYAPGPVGAANREVVNNIRLAALNGSSDVEIAAVGGTFPVWTPDSRHVVFSSDSGLWSVEVKDGKAVAQPELLRSDIRGVVPIGVRAGSYYYIDQPPAVDVIAIAAMERGGVRIEGKALTITKKILGIYPSWSPDGRRIAFRRRQSGGGDPLLVIHTIETGEERVYRRPGMKTAPGWWFHDGNSFLLSARREDGQQCLYRLDLRTGEFKDILTFGDEFLGTDYPIALDDRRIYLAGRSTDTPLGLFNRVVAVDVGTGQRQQVFSLPRSGSIMGVHLSPDGRSLLLSIEDGAARTKHLARVSVDGTEYRELVNGAAGFYIGVAWAPDSRGVLFSRRVGNSNDWQVMRIPAEGGTPVFTGLAARDQERLLIKLNHDGSRLAFSSTETVRELWALDNLLPNLK